MAKPTLTQEEIDRLNLEMECGIHLDETEPDASRITTPSTDAPVKPNGNPPPVVFDLASLGLATTDKGTPHNNLDNVVRIIENHPGLRKRVWYDEFMDAIMTDWCGPERQWCDRDSGLLQLYVQRHVGLTRISLQTCHDAALVAGSQDSRNELQAYLKALQWDGTERLAHLMSDGFGAQHDAYTQAVGRCWMVSMIARAFHPGCKVDTVPVLEGEQGTKKSSALAVLGGKWFVECHESVMSKDFFGVLNGHLLVEISEMHSFSRSEIERIKGIISCQVDRYRKAYGRHTEDHPRHTVLVGTTNRDDWHRDETGGRRFLPVLCKEINIEWMRENRDQLFAEAIERYHRVPRETLPEDRVAAGAAWWDIPEDEHKKHIESRRETDSWEPMIAAWLIGQKRVSTGDILFDCLKIDAKDQDQMRQKRVGRAMRNLGWRNRDVRAGQFVRKMWMRSDDLGV